MKSLQRAWSAVVVTILLVLPAPGAVAEDNKGETTFSARNSGQNMVGVQGELVVPGTGTSAPSPGSSQAFLGRSAPPPSADLGCVGQLSAAGWSGSDLCPYRFADAQAPEEVPTVDLLYHALAHTQVSSAGLVVEPWSRTYVGVPTLVHAATPVKQDCAHASDQCWAEGGAVESDLCGGANPGARVHADSSGGGAGV